ncbi:MULTISPECIES: hypothetical protein [Pseudomonadota]|uniref:hypothetical protein n=1 Tax=Pseudomonadota TaxID=1224 RepID=UPI002605E1FF|nr:MULTISPECIES: hypothetical protein [Pseudomonadota]
MNIPIELDPVWAILVVAVITALGNKWSGWEDGDRYSGSFLIGFFSWCFLGLPGISLGVAMLGWRLVGWQKSLDMGRNENSFIRDFVVMGMISAVPAIIIGLATQSWLAASLMLTMPICYTIAMWALPWKPQYRHITVAELLAGLTFGATGAAIILLT